MNPTLLPLSFSSFYVIRLENKCLLEATILFIILSIQLQIWVKSACVCVSVCWDEGKGKSSEENTVFKLVSEDKLYKWKTQNDTYSNEQRM